MSSSVKIDVSIGRELASATVDELLRLFDATYREANHDYLIASFGVLRFVAVARDAGKVIGFAAGDSVAAELPRVDTPQAIALAGICCVDASYRRHGLFGQLAIASIEAGGAISPGAPMLFCGRMAHSASYRAIEKTGDNVVPAAGRPITTWQREVMAKVAELYQVEIDTLTGRVIGKGRPIGYPIVDYEATLAELELFASVDRDNGDSLLAISWRPESPPGWLD